jgi:hypothetical protein
MKKEKSNKQKKNVLKKITFRGGLCLCLIVLTGVSAFCISTEDKITAENNYRQTERKVAGMFNGEPFFQEDVDVYIAELRAAVAAYYGRKYDLSGVGVVFWDTEFDVGTPRALLNKLALDKLVRNMALMQEARNRGVDVPDTYNELEKERAVWNIPANEIVFGPKTLAPAEYNSYRITGISDELKTALLQTELAPSTEQLVAAFESLPQDYKMAPYVVSGIRFRWDTGPVSDEETRIDIECSLQQGLSPEEIVNHLSASYTDLSQEEFKMNSRYISKEDGYERRLADVLRETVIGSCIPGPDERPELYYVVQKDGGEYYTFEEAPALGRNKWINDRFEEFLDEKVNDAEITLFAMAPAADMAVSIDLSKYNTVTEVQGGGTLKSRGKASSGATTYYIDYNNGNDTNSGTTSLQAWKTFHNVNLKTFNPGDHILLEANSIWNGTPVDINNYITQAQQRGNGGMLAPQGSGVSGNHCVIDLYEIKESNNGLTVYWSANRRPVINGNGTPYLNSDEPYKMSGVVHLEGQDYWEIRNLEVTNSFDFPEIATNPSLLQTHWYKREVPKSLVGMMMASTVPHGNCKGIFIENCYLHDVQSLHNNRPRNADMNDWYKSKHFGTVAGNPGGNGGGIFGDFTESVVQGNIIKRVAPIGLHTTQRIPGKLFVLRGNYFETIAGDAIIIGRVVDDNLVESNLIKDACAAPNFGVACYAAAWTHNSSRVLFQYNESWGTLYGYWDGEAWDVDNNCDQVIYQYNYSHHNAGGAILFMNTQTNSIFRYNISANDGGGSKYMETIASPGTQAIDSNIESYKFWPNGQGLIHNSIPDTVGGPRIPLVHNNTFYLGDGVSASIYGCVWDWPDKYVRFYNNIVLKTGAGEVRFSDSHGADKPLVIKNIFNPEGFRNNLLYAYQTDRKQDDTTKFKTGNLTMGQWVSGYDNIWADPLLKIQEVKNEAIFRKQRDDHFPETDYADPDKLMEYTGVSRMRMRTSLFTPLNGSPAIEAGMKIPAGNTVQEVDKAWNGNFGALSGQAVHWNYSTGLTMDMFGNVINAAKPPIGGAAKVYP